MGFRVSLQRSNPEPLMSALGHSRPSHFVPVLNNVRYASDSDHSRYESELTLWAKADIDELAKSPATKVQPLHIKCACSSVELFQVATNSTL